MLNRFASRIWLPESFVRRTYVLNPFGTSCNKDLVAGRTAVKAVLSIQDTFCRHLGARAPLCSISTRCIKYGQEVHDASTTL